MDKILERIGSYAASFPYEDLPASAIRAVKHKFIDTMGCALCAYLWEPCKIVRSLCFPMESGLTARVIGSLFRTTPEMAAFVNSTMVRTADFNDSYRIKRATHTSDAIPAGLAMAEAVHADGKRLITSIALTYEMGVLFSEKIGTMKDWNPDPCALAATLGSAMGAGKILGLNKEQFSDAASMALVANINLGSRLTGEHSMYKEVYAGVSARQGIFAALMARVGITGPTETIEGENGLNTLVDTVEIEPLGGNGVQFAVERSILKPYPARDAMQVPIKVALEVRKKVSPSEIKSVHVWTTRAPAAVAKNTPEVWAPETKETADHSMPFVVAAALIDGDVTVESYTRQRFMDKDIRDMMGKIRIDEDPEFTKQSPGKFNCRIKVDTQDGNSHTVHQVFTLDELRQEWTDEAVEGKFRRLARDLLTPAQIQVSLDLMWHLEDLDDAARILDNFQV
ncbi:MAG: MmgE/PrpD family protein [Deltaproteobacteria bacterium]|nr:MmgE/PrpD family protein [Deltaproteobacteria bacterium]